LPQGCSFLDLRRRYECDHSGVQKTGGGTLGLRSTYLGAIPCRLKNREVLLENALSALYSKGGEEKRLLEAMLLGVPR